jgi:Amt family ammonium transporter
MAALVTNLSACVGGIAWCVVDYRLEKKWSCVGFCSGVVAGLVAITPGSGYVAPWSAVVYGITAGMVCNFATQLKYWLNADDALDIFAVHGIGGVLGNLLTGIFAARDVARLDGYSEIPGGWVDRHWVQLAVQLADTAAGMTYSFVMTCIILLAISTLSRWLPALKLRASAEQEELGIDDVEIGEFAYDYVELVRDVKPKGMHDDHLDFESTRDGRSMRSMSRGSQAPFTQHMKNDYPLREFSRESQHLHVHSPMGTAT